MRQSAPPTVHATAVLVGARAVLIRGASGSGKSRLAFELLMAARSGALRFARLVGDDRIHLEGVGDRLLARPAEVLAGLIEVRGAGILRLDYEPCAVVGLVVDLGTADAERLPEQKQVEIEGVTLPRLAVAPGAAALPGLLVLLTCHTGLDPKTFGSAVAVSPLIGD
jgi:serine kinase of HPr protein (carbohydrate metabolism regulator)